MCTPAQYHVNSWVLRNSIPFSFRREDEELEELKEQNWELPLQDGEGCWTPGCLLGPARRGTGLP